MKSLMSAPVVILSGLWRGWLVAAAALLLASVPHLAVAADEVVTLQIHGDGWTVQQLDSAQDTWHNATIRLVLDGRTQMEELGAVRVRGSSSRGNPQVMRDPYAKKNYSLEFRDASGNDKKVSIPLLGLAAESDFVLHSSFWDPSYLRNVIAYDLYRQMGWWAPETRYINLMINGESRGLFVLTEKIKRGADRVDIPKLIGQTNGGCAVYGGYIFKREGTEGGWTWQSSIYPQITWTLHYPEPENATPIQKDVIKQYMEGLDYSFSIHDPTPTWEWGNRWPVLVGLVIDPDSWVDYTLLTELSMNGDGYWKSFFFYMQVNEWCNPTPLVMGPPWDFDLAFGNAGAEWWHGGLGSEGCRINGNMIHDDPDIRMPHIAQLWTEEPSFKQKLKGRWQALRQNTLAESNIMTLIDGYARSTDKSRQEDRNLWASKLWPRDGTEWPAPCDRRDFSLAGEVQALKDFIRQRLQFMDGHLNGF
jgi:CotH kinase protein